MFDWETDFDVNTVGEYLMAIMVSDEAGNDAMETIYFAVEEEMLLFSGDVTYAAAIEPYVIYVEFDVDMLDNFFVDYTAFTVVVDGVTANITDIYIDMYGLDFTVDEIISLGSVVTVSYQKTGTDNLTYSGYEVPDFADQIVDTTNIGSGSGDYTGGVMVATAFDANTIDIIFDVDTFDNAVIDQTAFTVLIDDVEATIINSFVNIDTVTLIISETMTDMTFVEVSYAPTGNSDLTYSGVLVPGFDNEVVTPPMDMPGF
jgi:hypothetical protein